MSDPERITLELTRERAEKVQGWAVRNIRALAGWRGRLNNHEREALTEYREIDAAVNTAIAAQLKEQSNEQ